MPFPQRIGPTELGTGLSTLFTANRPIRLTFVALTNRTSADKAVTMHVVPRGSTAVNANMFLPAMTVLANDLRTLELRIPMGAGDTLQGFSNVAGVVLIGEYLDEKKNL